MSFYSAFDENVNYDVEPRFTGEDGAAALMIESLNFEEQITLDMLKSDYLEAKAIKESASEEEIAAITEASVKDIAAKIKNFFIKLGKRIKEFVLGWVARIRAKLTSNNEKFYNKYKDQVNNAGDMKVDYRKTNPLSSYSGSDKSPQDTLDAIKKAYKISEKPEDPNKLEDASDVNKEDVKNTAVNTFFGKTDLKYDDLKKNLEEYAYKTSDKEEVTFDDIRSEVEDLLKNGNRELESLKRKAENAERSCKNAANEAEKGVNKNTRLAQRMSTVASVAGTVLSKSFSTVMSIYKEQLSQARTVFAKAVQYRPKED